MRDGAPGAPAIFPRQGLAARGLLPAAVSVALLHVLWRRFDVWALSRRIDARAASAVPVIVIAISISAHRQDSTDDRIDACAA